uniref:CxC2-like cysteine cluster KDZ transposase-associated domain-containing protein n=1 Tax=Mycena chlorophos TaxID=658473 RepID=A0ABQ0L4Q4_MYCCL|nr:predicted protein [Mycena chlorophos]
MSKRPLPAGNPDSERPKRRARASSVVWDEPVPLPPSGSSTPPPTTSAPRGVAWGASVPLPSTSQVASATGPQPGTLWGTSVPLPPNATLLPAVRGLGPRVAQSRAVSGTVWYPPVPLAARPESEEPLFPTESATEHPSLPPPDVPKPTETFDPRKHVRKQFIIHAVTSKKSAYDYVKALVKLTNNSNPNSVPDRYKEFILACRVWRFLALQRRTGQALSFQIDHHYLNIRRPGSMAVRCPACPEVSVNITLDALNNIPDDKRHIATLFVSADGNFKLQRKNKKEDPEDFALNDGNAYFVPTADYRHFVEVTKADVRVPEEEGVCDHLRVIRTQNISKFKNCVINGVVAIVCARHGFYMPQGMVDLPNGEAYKLTDYALSYALAEARYLRWIKLTYDIWCKYGIKLVPRFLEYFPEMADIIARINGAIGKLHLPGHKAFCQKVYSLWFQPHVGHLSGEIVETGWAEHKLTGGSTREMNDGHRHDVIDGTSDHWNWEKTLRMPSTLLRDYRDAMSELRILADYWKAVDNRAHQEHAAEVREWAVMSVAPKINVPNKGDVISVFEATFQSAEHTHRHNTDAALIEALIELELEKAELEKLIKENVSEKELRSSAEHKVRAARKAFYKKLVNIRSALLEREPRLGPHMKEVDFDHPEKAAILAPSEFDASQRTSLGLLGLAAVEFELRIEQGLEALRRLRQEIHMYNWTVDEKQAQVHGVGATTRAQAYLKALLGHIMAAGDAYRRSFKALQALGLPPTDTRFQPRGQGGLKLMKPGRKQRAEPWFWHVARPSGQSKDQEKAWELEMDRVQWFRARAAWQRATEEVEILEAELQRVPSRFERDRQIWTEIAEQELRMQNRDNTGWRAYAFRKAAMYERLRDECRQAAAEAPKLIEKDMNADLSQEAIKERREALEAEHRVRTSLASAAAI